jgi:shikimate kinase
MIVTKNIYLIGMPGSGKTTIGLLLSNLLQCHFYETDWAVVQKTGKTIGKLINTDGEPKFRSIEEEILLATKDLKGTIIATGGGLPCFFNNLDFMLDNGLVVCLQVPNPTIISRLQNRYQAIPALAGTDLELSVPEMLAFRSKFYTKANLTISLQSDNAQENALQIVAEIAAYLQ